MPKTLRDHVPGEHRRLLPVVFDRPAIAEPRATCDDCAMCAKPGVRAAGGIYFRADTKCCTYQPTLPNFLAGAILADESPELAEGRRRVERHVATRIGITPLWVAPSRKTRVLLEAARGTSFGRSRVLMCSYYDEPGGGRCTIWRHRESVCSTFFCKHERGAVADDFWMAEKRVLGKIELVLARAAAQAVSADVVEPSWPNLKLTVEDLEDRPPNDDDYAAAWGPWAGREASYYRACHAHVAKLTSADVDALLADEANGAEVVADMEKGYDDIVSTKIEERLVPNPKMNTRKTANGITVVTYSMFDTMELTPDLFELVNQFRLTETVAETRARLLAEHDLTIPDELLLALQQHRILVKPPSTASLT